MLHLVPALRIKDVTIFDLVDQNFYYDEFVFFSRLAAHLSKAAAISADDGQEVGVLSELMYLSSKIHFFLAEQTTAEQLQAGVQMPVLIGDLLYGRFLTALSQSDKTALLPIYTDYLRQFNAQQVHNLQQNTSQGAVMYINLLAEKTAEAVAALAELADDATAQLKQMAKQYVQEQTLPIGGELITTLDALEAAMQAELV